ncbi:superoxide dismutase, partial [Tricharina praecox]|uniref:superoxide dismutase n=1 Tax=Tricharina praecox TaxID=43433 RepID=UPI00221EF06A
MQFTAFLAASLLVVAASAQNVENPEPAAAILDNPVGVSYSATFDGAKGVTGALTFVAGADGKGCDITVKLSGFEGEEGPFGYHIHDQPVPADGNCTGTKAHLDPYGRGQVTPCDATKPETCEVGDLAGKHGKIPAAEYGAVDYSTSYNDLYASTKEGLGAFLGNRSIVIHRNDANKTRLACVNIVADEVTGYPSSTVTAGPGTTGSPSNNATNTTV